MTYVYLVLAWLAGALGGISIGHRARREAYTMGYLHGLERGKEKDQ